MLVTGLKASIKDSSLRRFMENKRRGAGPDSVDGDIERINTEAAIVHFKTVEGQ